MKLQQFEPIGQSTSVWQSGAPPMQFPAAHIAPAAPPVSAPQHD